MVSGRQLSVLLLCTGLTFYFGYHAIKGRHGLEARRHLVERSRVLEREIKALETVRTRLEREVALLDEKTADADFVEEVARDLLGLARPQDVILIEDERAP